MRVALIPPGPPLCFPILVTFSCFRSAAMGNLIKVLGKDLENCPHFFLDFESKSRTQNKGGGGGPINPGRGVTVLHQFGGPLGHGLLWPPWPPLHRGGRFALQKSSSRVAAGQSYKFSLREGRPQF